MFLLSSFNSEVKPKSEFFHLSIHVGDSIAEMRPICKQYQDKTEFLHLTETSLTQPVYLLSPVDGTFWGKLSLSHRHLRSETRAKSKVQMAWGSSQQFLTISTLVGTEPKWGPVSRHPKSFSYSPISAWSASHVFKNTNKKSTFCSNLWS